MRIAKERCKNCLLGPDALVSPAQVKAHLQKCARDDSHFICHRASMKGEDICCRGFYDTRTTNLIRVMGRLGAIEFVDLPECEPLLSYKEQQKRGVPK